MSISQIFSYRVYSQNGENVNPLRGASILNLSIFGKIGLFAYHGKAFNYLNGEKNKAVGQKIVPVACIFMSMFIGWLDRNGLENAHKTTNKYENIPVSV